MDPYRLRNADLPAKPEPIDPSRLASSCAVRARAGSGAFLVALVDACPELQILRDVKGELGEAFLEEHRAPRPSGYVVSVLGLWQDGPDTVCLDPSRSWWSETAIMERLSSRLSRVLCAMSDPDFGAFGVRWYEEGRRVRSILRVAEQLELDGPTMIEEVGVDIGRLEADGVRRIARLPSTTDLATKIPLRVVTVRDPIAESLLK
ncbi:MAG: hypothetical protein HOW73_15720 [Polyangiaceae bacterium]|nr:hypothetical protein [Polyangiaceae bacterium]